MREGKLKMIKIEPSINSDIEILIRWIKLDIDSTHHNINPLWWLTGNGILSYRIEDSIGITMYVRIDSEDKLMRLHTQFGPESEVSKIRVVKSLLWALPKMELAGKDFGLIGFVFKSVSPSLIEFMKKLGFTPIGNDDYSKPFEVREG